MTTDLRLRAPREALAEGERLALVATAVVGVGIVLADVLSGRATNLSGTLSVVPLIASTSATARRTAIVAAITVVVGFGLFLIADETSTEVVIRGVGLLGSGALAVWLADRRSRREVRMTDLTRFAAFAQELILRPAPPVLGHVRAAARYQSASSVVTVGGDLYDLALTPIGLRFIIGDACGKGLEGVRLASTVLASFRQSVFLDIDLAALAAVLDRDVKITAAASSMETNFVTAVLGELRPDGTLTFASCGHLDGLLLSPAGGTWLTPAKRSRPLGLGASPTPTKTMLAQGDRLLFWTDGVSEARTADGQFFDMDQHVNHLTSEPSVDEVLDELLDAVRAHSGGHLQDDVAILALELDAR
jgi:serine phosphatase RsbU (regulator of sigma subunit)